MKINDVYSFKARILPCMLILSPVLLLALHHVTFNELYVHYLTSLTIFSATTFLLSQIGRDQGKKKENKLFEYWGGKPTNLYICHSDDKLDKFTKKMYHDKLQQLIPDLKIPSINEEQNNPEEAKSVYESCTKILISKTRDINQYPLLFKENISYGFRRNLWGMKSWAISILIICIIFSSIKTTSSFSITDSINSADWIILLVLLVALAVWVFYFNRDWVKIPAFAYAERLYESLTI